ncbi:MAG: hypothetical protein WB460_00060 [Candidatus Acidiferrales bacterium]
MPVAEMNERKVRTTVSIPKPVYEEARSFVNSNAIPIESINGFFVAAIVAYVKLIRRKQIDAQFAAMAGDVSYQKQAKLIAEEFSQSDWEALEMAGE